MNRLWSFFGPKWQTLIQVADLAAEEVHARPVMGRLVAAVRLNDCLYVFDGRCPHAGQSLDGSEVTPDGIIECPRHGYRLSLDALPCPAGSLPVTHVPFRVRDGLVEIDREALVRTLR
jgi:nitrite reductase/ring-hydroxylating ferredoxin subunit